MFSIFHGLGRALVLLCKAGIVHRDIKDVNAVLFRDGHVKLIDFGSAIVISGTEMKGVPYLQRPGPPEADMMQMPPGFPQDQSVSDDFRAQHAVLTTEKTDLWALAYMIAELLMKHVTMVNFLDEFRKAKHTYVFLPKQLIILSSV